MKSHSHDMIPNSLTKKAISDIVKLHTPKGRRASKRFLVEGVRTIDYLLRRKWAPRRLLMTQDLLEQVFNNTELPSKLTRPFHNPILSAFSQADMPGWHKYRHVAYSLPESKFERLAQSSTPAGVIAEFDIPRNIYYIQEDSQQREDREVDQDKLAEEKNVGTLRSLSRCIDWSKGGVILDGVRDPGNVGTLIRSASLFGLGNVVLVECADLTNYKAVQSSCGAIADCTFVVVTRDLFVEMMNKWHQLGDRHNQVSQGERNSGGKGLVSPPILGALVINGEKDIDEWIHDILKENIPSTSRDDNQQPGQLPWLVIGSEAHGVSPEILNVASAGVTIPMPGTTIISEPLDERRNDDLAEDIKKQNKDINETLHVGSLNAAIAGSIAMYLTSRTLPLNNQQKQTNKRIN